MSDTAAIPPHGAAAARLAADVVRTTLGRAPAPVAGIILGSGLGALADRVEQATRIPYAAIPGFHATHVAGHRGELIHGTLAGREVLLLAGRFHMYEGHGARAAAFPVRVLHALGVPVLFVSNAAGGVRRTFEPGDLMLIEDQINLMFRSPLTGAVEPGDLRFPDMSTPYSARLNTLLRDSAQHAGVALTNGVYAGSLGPAYETPSEVRMLERLGVDATGMSTVPEVLVAAAIGLEVAGISLITNKAAGISPVPLDHADVVAVGNAAAARFCAVVEAFVARL